MNAKSYGLLLAVAAVSGLSASAANAAVLLGQYTFNEGGGTTAFDTSGNGTPANGTLTTSGAAGAVAPSLSTDPGYVDFGTGGGYVNFARPAKLTTLTTGGYTIEAWVKNSDTQTQGMEALIFGQDPSAIGITRYRTGAYAYIDGGANNARTNADNTGEHMIAATYDWDSNTSSGVLTIYYDGVSQASKNLTFAGTASGSLDFLTGTDHGLTQFLTGKIDQINYYDGALSSAQIAADHTAGPVPVPEPATLAVLGLGGLMLIRRRRK